MAFDTPWHVPRECVDCGYQTGDGNDWKGHHYRVCPECSSMNIVLVEAADD